MVPFGDIRLLVDLKRGGAMSIEWTKLGDVTFVHQMDKARCGLGP